MHTVKETLRLAQVELALMQKDNRIEELEARLRQLEGGDLQCPAKQDFRLDDDVAAPVQRLTQLC